ncbi:2,3,4,5-tetrahydropyridine-2,6-dicarboxylate N-succinyltransferase [Corynebacterium occultum]|uniref:2,3,4,5-tetrahydropyridine-2,6-dicarboxylate N-succinyltransferase n=1 Tax=Corynebacterium occultum TaxID=2675219 RepID=A0A6B8VV66_9CORY|nr:2,3,4,5-tetrahydropyridine-2,6-dicarboxylate N-succinyltransferase [Corynebacterium occultum]QGU06999.1 2,3,4,5-tetrahydropyridine-2,6-dicarboxylate N-succinyltransferase [Corynebacterium occultum]
MTAALAQGLATIHQDGTVLDVWFPSPTLIDDPVEAGTVRITAPEQLAPLELVDEDRHVERIAVETRIASLDDAPLGTYDAYLRLHLLSHRLVKPHGLNLDGIYHQLANVVWTNWGPCSLDRFEFVRGKLAERGPVSIQSVDKFPRMVDYVIPSGVRIADADRVRLGAYLSPGTTVMHEGFVNFNAGTLGTSMVEGRISSGVVIGDGTDIGGGASIMGTLSGGGSEVISLGKRCLLGANAGVGFPLGDDCTIEAGLYVTAGTRVTIFDELAKKVGVFHGSSIRASKLSGFSRLLFRRNSVSGSVEASEREVSVALNRDLHQN